MNSVNPFQFQTVKFFDNSEDDRDVLAVECPIVGINMHMNKKIVKFRTTITDDILLKAKWSENTVVQPALLLDMRTDTREKKQTKIFSKVKSAKDNVTNLFKATGRVSPAISNLGPLVVPHVQQDGVQDVHLSPSLTQISQRSVSEVRDVTISSSLPSKKTILEAITLFAAYSEHTVEEHVNNFISIPLCAAESPLLSLPAQLPTVPKSQRTSPSIILLNELPTIEEEVRVPEPDAEGLHVEPEILATSSSGSCGLLTTSDSEATHDAMLAAEFATFSFDSNNIQEWSDEVEREKQAKMDAHFAHVSEALAVPVPKLSAYFGTIHQNGFISDPSPVKTETSETNTSSADSSLVTSVDAEEDRAQPSPMLLRELRRVRHYDDLKNIQMITSCSDSFSDLSCWSFDLDPSDSTTAGSKIGALRRSVKCNDLRKSFLSLECGICHTPNREREASNDQLSSIWPLGDSLSR